MKKSVFVLLCCSALLATRAPAQTIPHVTGTFKTPEGKTPSQAGLKVMATIGAVSVYGSIDFQPYDSSGNKPTRILCGGITYVPSRVRGWIKGDGTLVDNYTAAAGVDIVPNTGCTPAGLVTRAFITLSPSPDGRVQSMTWTEDKTLPQQASVDWGTLAAAGVTAPIYTGYSTVAVAGVVLTPRNILNFTSGSCTDNPATLSTDCAGGGGGGSVIQTSGVNNTLQTPLNFQSGSVFNGLTINPSNPSGGNEQFALSGTLNDGGLTSAYSGVGNCSANQFGNSFSRNTAPGCTLVSYAGLSGVPSTFAPAAHNLLSAAHGDTTTAAAVRGDALFAIGVTPTWQRVAHPASTGGYFKWNGTDMVASTGAAGGTGACGANQFQTGANADAAPGCAQPAFTNLSGAALKAQLPAVTVYTDQTNAYGAFLQDFSSGTLKIPAAAGFAASASSTLGIDTTGKNPHIFLNALDSILPFASATGSWVNGDCAKIFVSAGQFGIADNGAVCGSGSFTPQTNGVTNATTTGLNFITSTVNAAGLTITPSNPATTQEKFEITGTTLPVSGGTGLSSPAAHSLLVAEGGSNFVLVTSPALNGFYACGFNVTASAAVDPGCALQGVPVNAQSTNYTMLYSDRASYEKLSGGTTATFTLPQVTGNTAGNFPFVTQNGNSGNLTLTANAADKIDNSATGGSATVLPNFAAFVYQDSSSAPGNWWTIKFPTFAAFGASCGDATHALNWSTTTGFGCQAITAGVSSFSGDGSLISNSGSTGAVTATLATAAAHKFWGNATGSTGAASYSSIGTADLPTGIPNANLANPATTVNGITCTLGSTCNVGQLNDTNGNATVKSLATASAVDQISVTNAATANPATVTISATGTDANINLNLVSKGTGAVQCNGASCGGGGGTVTTTGSPANGNLTKFSGTGSITNGDLSGDVTTAGTLAATVVKVNGGSVPVSAKVVGSNASAQPIAALQTDLNAIGYAVGGGTAQAQTVTLAPAITAYADGFHVCWKPAANNTAPGPTLAVNGLTATTVTKLGATPLAANDISTAAIACAQYNSSGPRFELKNPQGVGSVVNITAVTATNPSAEASLMALSLPAGFLNVLSQPYAIHASGKYTIAAAQTPTLRIRAKLCTVSGCGSGTVVTILDMTSGATTASATNSTWNLDALLVTNATGATGNALVHGTPGLAINLTATATSAATVYSDQNTATSANIDLTAALFVQFTVLASSANAGNTVTQDIASLMPQSNPAGSAGGGGDMLKNATNTMGASGTIDNSAETGANAFKVPVQAGAVPTANGAASYDSTANVPKVGVNGATYNALTTDPAHQIMESDNFCATDNANRIGTHLWIPNGPGSMSFATSGPNPGSTNYPCGVAARTGATSGNSENVNTNATQGTFTSGNFVGSNMEFDFQLEQHTAAPQQSLWIGWLSAGAAGNPSNFFGLRLVETTAGANFFFVCRSAGVDGTATDTTVAANTSIHKFKLQEIAANSYKMQLDGGTLTTINTGCPASFLGWFGMKVDTTEAVSKGLDLWYWQWDNQVAR